MKITNATLRDLIFCSYKAFNNLKKPLSPVETEISVLFTRLKESHFKRFFEHSSAIASFSFSVKFQNECFDLTFDAIEEKSRSNKIAVMTIPFEKVSKNDKLLLALTTSIACREFSLKVSNCKIIYGNDLHATYFKPSTFKRQILALTNQLEQMRESSLAPVFHRNDHCPSCRFRDECHKALRERDDLSLLAGMKPKEVASKNGRGIFTIRQLSFMFRAKKNPYVGRSYRPELKALAIRENKTYILEGCSIPKSSVEVFLDIESIPERKFHYLIGMIIRTKGRITNHSLWADTFDDQKRIFGEMLFILSKYDDVTIYHYGSYEKKVLLSLNEVFPEYKHLFEKNFAKSFNVLSLFTQYVYPPTYSNGLKEVAKFLNFTWSDATASGLQSIVWRYNWECSFDEALKQKLAQYNVEDCTALMTVFDWLCSALTKDRGADFLPEPQPINFYKWGVTNYAISDFESINEKAYFNYQRNHIRLRNGKSQFRRTQNSPLLRINKPRKWINLFPSVCPKCKCTSLKTKPAKKMHIDLTLMKTGFKSSVTIYEGGPFACTKCEAKFKGTDMRNFPKYGRNLMIWSVNQKIQYNLSSQSVINVLRDTVKIKVSPTQMTRFKEVIAGAYKKTYAEIRERLINSKLIHADETIARIKGIDGYVWVLANHECVYYEFKKTREAGFLKILLTSFKGTLVSDFYTGYDSIACAQQKCLIHLIRDLNADFLKNQFDQDYKSFVLEFGKLLKKIVSTIDRFGLKKFHLHKHLADVNKFYHKVVENPAESEVTQNYQRRFKKYREKLFHFLTDDNIPWNNNNAEHSVKPFAKWRKQKSSSLSISNIENHLILLSILQTCKYKGVSFFEFLKSGELSIFEIPKIESNGSNLYYR